jgi:hypothetical protein
MKFGLGPWWKKLFIYAQVVSQNNNIHIFVKVRLQMHAHSPQ